jgi:hypothetical protein
MMIRKTMVALLDSWLLSVSSHHHWLQQLVFAFISFFSRDCSPRDERKGDRWWSEWLRESKEAELGVTQVLKCP